MHRVWIVVDWGVPVRKLTRYHVRFLLKVDFGLPCANFSTQDDFGLPRANFSTQDDLDLEASRTSRKQTRHHVACVAREGTLMWIRTKLLLHALVSGLESIQALRSENKHGIMQHV